MYEISSGVIKVGINPIGAELEYVKINNINILWNRSESWNSQSPVLFPIIGALKDGFYSYQGQRYEIEVHGFIKTMNFEVAHLDNNKIVLSRKFNELTLKKYPFKFEMLITYLVDDNSLKIFFEIRNLDSKDMSFSVGIHPGFSYKGLNELLEGPYKFNIKPKQFNEVYFSPSFVKEIKENSINYDTFDEMSNDLSIKRTICLENVKQFEIVSNKHKLIFINNMSYMAFWQKNPENNPEFICIEGWDGIPDEDFKKSYDIFDKLGNKVIKANKTYITNFELIFK